MRETALDLLAVALADAMRADVTRVREVLEADDETVDIAAEELATGLADAIERTVESPDHPAVTDLGNRWREEIAARDVLDENPADESDVVDAIVDAVESGLDVELAVVDGLDDEFEAAVAGVARDAVEAYRSGTANTELASRPPCEPDTDFAGALERAVERLAAVRYEAGGRAAHDRGDLETAERCYREALERARDFGLRRVEAAAVNDLGVLADDRGETNVAIARVEEGRRIYCEADDRSGAATAVNNLAMLRYDRDDTGSVRERLDEGLEHARAANVPATEGLLFEHLGLVATDDGDRESAADRYRDALDRYREAGSRHREARVLSKLARIERRRGDLASAADTYEQALELARDIGDRERAAVALYGLALTAAAAGRDEAAERFALRSYRRYEELGNTRKEALALNVAGGALTRIEGAEMARPRFETALELLVDGDVTEGEFDVDDPEPVFVTLKNLANAAARAGDWEEAVTWCRRAIRCADTVEAVDTRVEFQEKLQSMRTRKRDQDVLDNVGDMFSDLL